MTNEMTEMRGQIEACVDVIENLMQRIEALESALNQTRGEMARRGDLGTQVRFGWGKDGDA